MPQSRTARTLTLLSLALLPVGAVAAESPLPLYVYVSTGDNQWVSDWPPVDSPATIAALFEWLHDTWGARRVYWRGEQEDMWLQDCVFRPENPRYLEWWTVWVAHLVRDVKTNDLAVRAARKLGMEVIMWAPLFDHGAPGDVGGCGMFPYATQDRLLIEHPQWRPVDRWGERHAPGPPEFAYPELRKILVERHVRHVVERGYAGLCFYTYVENMGQRYMDEFGFSEPIVAEFKRRYGVDIRREPFDKEAWNKLRGEYVTQFLDELHTALKAKGKTLTVIIRPDEPNLPQRWLCQKNEVLPTGAIYMDWEGWVRRGLVDELYLYGNVGRTAQKLIAAVQGTPVKLAVLSSSPFHEAVKPVREAGMVPCSVAAPGYGINPWAREATSPETLTSPSWRLRAQTLVDIAAGTVQVPSGEVAARLQDPQVLVRREAIRTLAKLAATQQAPAVEAALADGETSVRTAAATALGAIGTPSSAAALLNRMERDRGFQYREAAILSLIALKDGAVPALQAHATSRQWWVREAVMRTMVGSTQPSALDMIRRGLADADYRVRFSAVGGARRLGDDEGLKALLTALQDRTPTVQLLAAKAIGDWAATLPAGAADQAFGALRDLFTAYGDGSRRSDADWGWRVVGMALQRFGDRGKTQLEQWRDQRTDRWLAWNAYLVLHVPQNPQVALTCTEEEAVATHNQYAPPFPGGRE